MFNPTNKGSAQYTVLERALEHVTLDQLDTPEFPLDLTEENIERFRELVLAENPQLKSFFTMLEDVEKRKAIQAGKPQPDKPTIVIQSRRGTVTPELLEKHLKTSPTARDTLAAYRHFEKACKVIRAFPKDKRVLTKEDCEQIEPGLRGYIEGYILAQFLITQFPFPHGVEDLVDDYLKLRPHDVFVDYFRVIIIVNMKSNNLWEYEGFKMRIRALEEFINRILPYKSDESVRKILAHAYYMVGAQYTITNQDVRALDAFQKWHEIDPGNLESLYSIAYHLKDSHPDKALKLLNEYVAKAPKCAEKYPNAFYLIGYVYGSTLNNITEALKWYQVGEEAEMYRLPFNPETEFFPKTFLQTLKIMYKKELAEESAAKEIGYETSKETVKEKVTGKEKETVKVKETVRERVKEAMKERRKETVMERGKKKETVKEGGNETGKERGKETVKGRETVKSKETVREMGKETVKGKEKGKETAKIKSAKRDKKKATNSLDELD